MKLHLIRYSLLSTLFFAGFVACNDKVEKRTDSYKISNNVNNSKINTDAECSPWD